MDQSIGTFEITSGVIVVADPIHGGASCGGTLSVRCGTWLAAVRTFMDDNALRVSRLAVQHAEASLSETWERAPFAVMVDDGRAAFWDAAAMVPPRRKDDVYGAFDRGAWSRSGWGDGAYVCDVQRDAQGTVIAAALSFDASPPARNPSPCLAAEDGFPW
jgi:hypothetical protein